MLEHNANNFLKTTDEAYDECATGIAHLDRIIVAVCSNYSAMTRGYLLPIVYAYWERFFRIVFSEFLICIEANNVPVKNVNKDIAKFRIRKEIVNSLKNRNVGHLHELPNMCCIADLQKYFEDFAQFCEKPITFPDPSDWISTDSNVKFAVLEKNCKNLGLNINEIKLALKESNMDLFPNLKNLVDARNKIAHGQTFEGVKNDEWELMKAFVLNLMTSLQLYFYEFLKDEKMVYSHLSESE